MGMKMKKYKLMLVCLVGFIVSMPTAAVAGADSGFYLGLGLGDSTVKNDELGIDESDRAYKVLFGYNFGVIPLIDLAIEGSYAHFGTVDSGPYNVEVTGLDAFGLAGLSFGPFGIFVKAGVIDWGLDTNDGTITNSESGTDPAYGIGARLAFGSLSLRAEYEYFDLDSDVELGMASISGIYTF